MRNILRFVGDEQGAVTIEFTVLLPFFIFMLVIFADASIIWLTHSEMYNAARDIARKMSVGTIASEQEAADYAAQRLFLGDRTYTVDATFGNDRVVRISVPVADAAIFGTFFGPVIGRELSATAVMRRERPLVPS